MKQIFRWLETQMSRHRVAIEVEESRRVECSDPGKIAPMPDIYGLDRPVKKPRLVRNRELVPEAGESIGFDPYNTGGFNTPKTPE